MPNSPFLTFEFARSAWRSLVHIFFCVERTNFFFKGYTINHAFNWISNRRTPMWKLPKLHKTITGKMFEAFIWHYSINLSYICLRKSSRNVKFSHLLMCTDITCGFSQKKNRHHIENRQKHHSSHNTCWTQFLKQFQLLVKPHIKTVFFACTGYG